MGQKNIRLSKPFLYLLRQFLGRVLKAKYNIRTKNRDALQALPPPYIVLSNHFNTFDPFIISTVAPVHIHWVASDLLFRNPYLKFMLRRLVGSIAKSKSKSDFQTIRQIGEVIRRQGVVGIFPEGQRSWDGKTLPLMYATAKLVRMLKVPVVFCILEGGYHSLPRWSNKRRKGQLTVAFQDPWLPEEFAAMSADEIFQEMTRRLSFDDYAHQQEHRIVYHSRRRAEYLEHVLFVCPSCLTLSSMVSRRNSLSCSHCGLTAELDSYGFFSFSTPDIHIKTVADWNRWQREYITEQMTAGRWGDDELILSDSGVTHYTGYRDRKMKKQGKVWIGITPAGCMVEDKHNRRFFAFDQIDSLSVVLQRKFEFYLGDTLHQFHFPAPRTSAYKYLMVYECREASSSALEGKRVQ